MQTFPTDEEVELAADLLATKYDVSAQLLGRLFDTEQGDQANSIKRHGPTNSNISSPSYMRKPLVEKKWHAGKHWTRDFVAALGFPSIFAGVVHP